MCHVFKTTQANKTPQWQHINELIHREKTSC